MSSPRVTSTNDAEWWAAQTDKTLYRAQDDTKKTGEKADYRGVTRLDLIAYWRVYELTWFTKSM